MQLLMLNFLIMFDVVFVFFLFLIAVTCIMNYVPGKSRTHQPCPINDVKDDVIPPPPLFAGDGDNNSVDNLPATSRDTYVVMTPPPDDVILKDTCPVHVV